MIFIFFLALILFGPKKMPEIGRQGGALPSTSFAARPTNSARRSSLKSTISRAAPPNSRFCPRYRPRIGSLASRIFNPPSPEKLEAVEDEAAEQAAVKAAAAESVAPSESTHTPKAAPDA